jgi:hypothetical protein
MKATKEENAIAGCIAWVALVAVGAVVWVAGFAVVFTIGCFLYKWIVT